MQERTIVFNAPGGWPLAIALALLTLFWLVWFYRRMPRPVSLRLRIVLGLLKLGAFAVALLFWLRPAMRVTHYEVKKPLLVFMIDQSRSMEELRDGPGGRSRSETVDLMLRQADDLMQRLSEHYEVRRVPFAQTAALAGELRPEELEASAYGDCLDAVRQNVAGAGCAGIVLIGDGSSNYGQSDPVTAAIALGAREIPIYAVGVGDESRTGQVRDVKVVDLKCPQTAFLNAMTPVEGRILVRGYRGQPVTVRLSFPGRDAQTTTIRALSDSEVIPVEFTLAPDREGEFKLTLRALTMEGELLDQNNVCSTWIKVVKGGIIVAVYDRLRPESKFVGLALAQAEQLSVRRFIWPPAGSPPAGALDWTPYDVVVIGDVPAISFGETALDRLLDAVEKRGKGLVLLVGEQSGGSGGFAGSVLESALPVTLPSEGVHWRRGPFPLVPQPEALREGMLKLSNDADPMRLWRELPSVDGIFAGPVAKRSAAVLLAQEGAPVLAVQQFGRGRVACVMTNSTFRWYFTRRETQDAFIRFWRQLLLWAGSVEDRPRSKVWIAVPRRRVAVGDALPVEVHVLAETGAPVPDAQIETTIRRLPDPDAPPPANKGPERTEPEKPVPFAVSYNTQLGAFTGRVAPREAGDYELAAGARAGDKPLGEDSLRIVAQPFDRELDEPVADHALLTRIAQATRSVGGDFFPWQRFATLLGNLLEKSKRAVVPRTEVADVWDRPSLFALLVGLVLAEWIIRRIRGLV